MVIYLTVKQVLLFSNEIVTANNENTILQISYVLSQIIYPLG